jgi:tellurite resistance protein TehA-like permease
MSMRRSHEVTEYLAPTGSPWAWFGADDWIVMGGLAIAALAATQITLAARAAPAANTVLGGLGPGASVVAMTAWVAASGWILPLAILQLRCIARALVRRGHRRTAPDRTAWWAAVFPLGMYAVASHALVTALGLATLEAVAQVFLWIALAAWLATSLGIAAPWLAGRAHREIRLPGRCCRSASSAAAA